MPSRESAQAYCDEMNAQRPPWIDEWGDSRGGYRIEEYEFEDQ
jgi:hypothetical protein